MPAVNRGSASMRRASAIDALPFPAARRAEAAVMWANDTNYTVIKNGVVVVSGTGPAIRVDGNRLIIRDGPQETSPLVLTRAEATRKLRHVVVCGHAGGFVTFEALRWLRDTGGAFSQLDYNGRSTIA